MLKKSKWQVMLLGWIAAGLLFPRKSYAYLDLGSGSYFLQMLMAGVFAASVVLKTFWGRIKLFLACFFSKAKRHEKNDGH